MRAVLFAALLAILLAVGVVQAHRNGETQSLLLGWLRTAADAPAAAAVPGDAEPAAPAPAHGAPDADPQPAVLAAGEVSVLDGDAPDPMVRYQDAQGSIHMVRGLASVPAAHRASAVVVGRGNVNVIDVPAPSAVAFRDWRPAAQVFRGDVVLFSAEWCGACKRAKRYLDGRGIHYEERDIDDDASARQEVFRILGRVAIPLLGVDGRYVSGFRPDVYERALAAG